MNAGKGMPGSSSHCNRELESARTLTEYRISDGRRDRLAGPSSGLKGAWSEAIPQSPIKRRTDRLPRHLKPRL